MEANEISSGGAGALNSSKRENITLNILSPSVEVPSRLSYSKIPTSTTIAELKRRIQNDVETRPSPERQRLIYRGRALVQEEKTLAEIFGDETIQGSDTLSLHLVLPPIPTGSSTGTSNTSMRQHIPINIAHDVPQRPASTGQLHGTPVGRHALPGMTNDGLGNLAWHGNTQGPPLPPSFRQLAQIPHPMQEILNNQLAAFAQQQGRQGGVPAFTPAFNIPNGPNHTGAAPQLQQGPTNPSSIQRTVFQDQQSRTNTPQQAGDNDDPTHSANQSIISSAQSVQPLTASHGTPNEPPNHPAGPGITHSIVREGQGPGGSQWRMTINSINSSTSTYPPNASFPANLFEQQLRPVPNQHSAHPTGNQAPPPSTLNDLDHALHHLERNLDNGIAPPDGALPRARQVLDLTYQQQNAYEVLRNNMATRLNNLTARTYQMSSGLGGATNTPTAGTTTSLPVAGNAGPSTMVYLLSSPAGPQALVLSPSGMFSTPGLGVSVMNPMSSTLTQVQPPAAVNQAVPAPERAAAEQGPPRQDPQQGGQPPQPEQARDLVRIIIPLGGHLWLLVRLFGFVYFFTSGAGWYRTMLLGLCAVAVFIVQTGVLRPLQLLLWEPFRRHVEALVPLAGNNGDAVVAHGPPAPDGQGQNAGPQTPRQLADRLLNERNRAGGIIRRNIRRVERATALFIASLVPGVGERHIAARGAVEAERQAAQRERAELAAREQESTQEAEHGQENNEGDNFADADDHLVRRGEPTNQPNQQHPLVEI